MREIVLNDLSGLNITFQATSSCLACFFYFIKGNYRLPKIGSKKINESKNKISRFIDFISRTNLRHLKKSNESPVKSSVNLPTVHSVDIGKSIDSNRTLTNSMLNDESINFDNSIPKSENNTLEKTIKRQGNKF